MQEPSGPELSIQVMAVWSVTFHLLWFVSLCIGDPTILNVTCWLALTSSCSEMCSPIMIQSTQIGSRHSCQLVCPGSATIQVGSMFY